MNKVTISLIAQQAPEYNPANNATSLNNSIDHTHFLCHVTATNETDHPDTMLSAKIRKPLANLNLAAEMLEALLKEKENDLDIYMEVIRRSSKRIYNLITEFNSCPQINILHLENISYFSYRMKYMNESGDRNSL